MTKRSCHSPLKGIIVEVDHSEAIQKGGILGVKTERCALIYRLPNNAVFCFVFLTTANQPTKLQQPKRY